MTLFAAALEKIERGDMLDGKSMAACIDALFSGGIDDAQASAFLSALHERGESAEEIAGAASALRARAATIVAPPGAIDCCGTGGDSASTYNISTAVAFVAAACGVPVAKHGNRSASSKSGAADVLEQLGVPLDLPHEILTRALKDLNFCFLMAPRHHAAMKHVAAVRKSLGHRTIFNLLGPLANPAGTRRQLVGVFASHWVRPMAEALGALGSERALVVHGDDGLDEITLGASTRAALLKDGAITDLTFTPANFDLPETDKDSIKGGDAAHNAAALRGLLDGAAGPYRDVVLANTAAVLMLHDDTPLRDGVARARNAIDSGRARAVLERYTELGQ